MPLFNIPEGSLIPLFYRWLLFSLWVYIQCQLLPITSFSVQFCWKLESVFFYITSIQTWVSCRLRLTFLSSTKLFPQLTVLWKLLEKVLPKTSTYSSVASKPSMKGIKWSPGTSVLQVFGAKAGGEPRKRLNHFAKELRSSSRVDISGMRCSSIYLKHYLYVFAIRYCKSQLGVEK